MNNEKNIIRMLNESDGMMSPEELRDESLVALKNMKRDVNQFTVRDKLASLTAEDFYPGEMMASVDQNGALDVIENLMDFLNRATPSMDKDSISKIYDKVYRWSR